MQQENQSDLFSNNLSIDHTAKQHILSMASWAIVIVVVAVIGYAISLFQSLGTPRTIKSTEGFGLALSSGSNTITTVIGILLGLLVNFFLFRFATQARNAVNGLDQTQLNASFGSMKAYFMIAAIYSILIFLVVILALVFLSTRA